MTDAGVYGTISTSNETNTPLFELGSAPVKLVVNQLQAFLPDKKYVADGNLHLLSDPYQIQSCVIENIDFSDQNVATSINCQINEKLQLVQNSDQLSMDFNSLRGIISPNWVNGQLNYDLEGIGEINMQSIENNTCGINILMALTNETGVDIQANGSACYATNRTFDLGLAELIVEDMALNDFTYNSVQNEWDFDISFNSYMRFPVFDHWTSPMIEGIRLDQNGIQIPRQEWDENSLNDASQIEWQDFALNLSEISVAEINYPWFDDIKGLGPWEMNFEGELTASETGNYPNCLQSSALEVTGAYNEAEGIGGSVSVDDISCRWDFGAGYALDINGVKGSLTAAYLNDEFNKSAELRLQTDVQLGNPFSCNSKTVEVANTEIIIRNGIIEGNINDFAPDCPVQVGPFEAIIDQSDISFYRSNDAQSADLDARATLTLTNGPTVNGTFLLDMITGTYKEVNFELDEPFTWDIPEDDPVMSFYIENTMINEGGLLIDGRNELRLPQQSIDATFDNLLLDLNDRRVKSGSVIFDESFAFEAGLDPNDFTLDYNAVSPGEQLTVSPGVYFELGENVILDSLGLRTRGTAGAELIFNDQNLTENFSVEFTDDFTIQLYPFSVNIGRADLVYQDKRMAYIDASGFNIDAGQFATDAIPDRIPLPTEEIAYLIIKENGQLIVDINELNDGSYQVNTLPNQPLSLFIPALDPANPPEIANVSLNNVVLNPDLSSPSFKSGSITATVPENDPRFNLPALGIPLSLKEVSFGTNLFTSNLTALFFSGDLYLFEQEVTNDGSFSFFIQSDGNVQGNFDLQLNQSVNLVQGSDLVTFDISQINGFFDLPLLNGGSPSYEFNLDGGLAVNATTDIAAEADMALKITPGDFAVTQFNPVVDMSAPELDLGYFGVKINEIPALPEFRYDKTTGFEFAAQLDMELSVELSDNQAFNIPLNGIEISHRGLELPPQDISSSSIPGLDIPSLTLQGIEIKPLALRTTTKTVFDWYNGIDLNLSPAFDFEVRLPAFEGTGFNPQDGFTFYNVTFDQGILAGDMSPYIPQGDIFLPLSALAQTAKLKIEQITGIFKKLSTNDGFRQGFDFDIEGSLHEIPGFTNIDPNQCVNPTFSLSIVDGSGFEGTVSNFAPCGVMELGPFSLAAQSSTLSFIYQNQKQAALLDGTVRLDLIDNPSTNGLADGNLTIDLVNGQLTDGFIQINQSFPFALPVDAADPVLAFTVNQARLDTTGFMFTGNGSLDVANTTTNVSFNNLKLSLDDFSIKDGSANLGSSFALQLGLRPIELGLVDANSSRPSEDHLRMNFSGDVQQIWYWL